MQHKIPLNILNIINSLRAPFHKQENKKERHSGEVESAKGNVGSLGHAGPVAGVQSWAPGASGPPQGPYLPQLLQDEQQQVGVSPLGVPDTLKQRQRQSPFCCSPP